MSVRASMADLLVALRLAIGDPVTDAQLIIDQTLTQTFTDQQLQDALDRRRTDVVECVLAARPTTASGGLVTYHEFFAPRRPWETSVVLQGNTYAALSPDTSDFIAGRWTFVADITPPIFITGATYDLPGAAYDLLQAWAARVATEFDFATDGQEFDRSQKRRALVAQATEYARHIVPVIRPPWHAEIGQW